MEKNYVVYHLHSDLSNGVTNIDSVTKYNEYIDYAKSLGMKAMAFSEHGSVLEWVHKKNAIEKAGMKYIHAEEFYVTKELYQYPDDTELCESLLGTDPEEAQKEIEEFLEGNKFQVRDNYHCVLIAKNYEGVKEINALSSKAFARDGHFYYQPRISFEELINTSDNILITTACIGGILASGTPDIQEEFLNFLVKNKDRCYLEIQHHCDDMQIKYNQYLAKISTQYGIPLIAGTDTHSLNDEHMRGRAIMQRSKDVKFDSESAWDMTFKSYDELIAAYEKQFAIAKDVYLKAIEETNRMADRIEEFYLDYSYKYPKLYEDSLAEIKKKIVSGIKWRGIDKKKNYKEYQDRIVYELKTYIHNNALDFMLLEEDYKTELRKDGVKYGYSRGSVSGSLIAYLLGITEVDPIRFNLNFERFMNEERVSLADIDSDWFKEDRWKVREYLFNREKLYCCNIITFNTVKMKGAIKDVGRALGMTPQETQALSNLVQEDENKHEFVEEKYRLQYQELFEYVDIVVGTITSLGRHAAGLVVSPYPVEDVFGTLYISSDEKPISQINMKEIDSLNFVKLDVLGLDCVGLIYKTCEAAGIPFLTPDNLDFNDEEVWEDIAKDTTLIFQFESDFAGSYLRDILRPQVIKKIKEKNPNLSYIDLMSMANGAIRPAGESYRTKLAAGIYRDNGNDALNKFLAPTLGFLVYQEQIIEFLHRFCGFTMGEADIVRRHFSKKTGTETDIPIIKDGGYMNNIDGKKSEHYIKGFIKTMKDDYGVDQVDAEQIIESFLQVIMDASNYLFSKNHADPYSFLGFACGYLRHYYPLETLTTALNIYASDDEKSLKIKDYVISKGYEILPIQFRKSKAEYQFDKNSNSIYQGISSIKFCNEKIADELFELGKNNYANFFELLFDINEKTSVNSKQLMILTGLNFFKEFGENKYLLKLIEYFDKFAFKKQINKKKLEELGVTEFLMKKYSGKETATLFKELDNIGILCELSRQVENKAMGIIESMKFEKEYLGSIMYTNPKVSLLYYMVTDFKTYKDTTKPYITARQIRTGKEVKTRIKQGKIFKENPFGQWSVLKINEFSQEFKKRPNAEGKWEATDELEDILTEYEVIR
ncbi:MAG: PHP domain-containing protein [Mediterraneibacter gnavus]